MRLWAFVGATVAAVAVFVAVVVLVGTTDRRVTGFKSVEDRELFPELDSRLGQVETIEIKSSDRPLVFKKAEDGWRSPQHYEHPVREAKVEKLLQTLVSLHADYVSDTPSGSQVSGIANPSDPSTIAVRVRLLSPEGKLIAGAVIGHELTIPVGTGQSRMLVRGEQDERAWLASPVVRIETNPRAWLKRDIVDVPRERVTRLVVAPREGDRIALERSEQRGLHVAEGISGDDLAGEPQLEAIAGALERLRFDDVRPLKTILDRSRDDGHTVVATSDGLDYTIRWLSDEDQKDLTWATFSAEEEGSQAKQASPKVRRFNDRHAIWAYKLPAHVVQYLRVRPTDLGHTLRTRSGDAPKR